MKIGLNMCICMYLPKITHEIQNFLMAQLHSHFSQTSSHVITITQKKLLYILHSKCKSANFSSLDSLRYYKILVIYYFCLK